MTSSSPSSPSPSFLSSSSSYWTSMMSKNRETLVDGVAGWCSGAAAVMCCQPIDTILTRYQASRVGLTTIALATTGVTATPTAASNTVAPIMASLWRGSTIMITAVPFQNALLMTGYGWGKRYYDNNNITSNNNDTNTKTNPSNTTWQYYGPIFVGGTVGGVLQSFLMSPVELIKVQQQMILSATSQQVLYHQLFPSTLTNTNTGTNTATATTLSSRKWWTGLNATLLRDGIPHGVWFASYEWCKHFMMKYDTTNAYSNTTISTPTTNHNNNTNASTSYASITVPIVSGAFAATVAWTVGYPADVIKTRIQAGTTAATATRTTNPVAAASGASGGGGIVCTAMELYQEGALYRGFGLKLVRSIPASMIGFVVYEQVAKQF